MKSTDPDDFAGEFSRLLMEERRNNASPFHSLSENRGGRNTYKLIP